MDFELVEEIKDKIILHWNYREYEEVPEELRYIGSHVEEIYLKNNRISYLPEWFNVLCSLTHLYLQGNQLHKLTHEIGDILTLEYLDISNNCLKELPSSIGNLTNLQSLQLRGNQISNIPHEISKLQNLQILNLSCNKLYTIQDSLCDCENLQYVDLDENFLISLPRRITSMSQLKVVSVKNNRLVYLPCKAFVTQVKITVDDNPTLTYIPQPLLGCISGFGANRNIHYKPDECLLSINNCIITSKEKKEKFIMPKEFRKIFSRNVNPVMSLYELSMREVYLDITNKKECKSLPLGIQHELQQGPVAECYNNECKAPLFTSAVVWLLQQKSCKVAVFICSKKCSIFQKEYHNLEGGTIDW